MNGGDTMQVKKKTVVVTGGAQGIGSAIVQRFASKGYTVFVLEADAEAAEEFRSELGTESVTMMICDIADSNNLREAFEQIAASGGIDVLVNNAAVISRKPLSQITLAEWERVMAVNLTAPFLAAKFCEKYLRASKGSIINLASTRALMSEPDTEPYSASKGGIVALTHALAVSLAPDVRVNAISPGWIDVSLLQKKSARKESVQTEADKLQHPAGRVGCADDIASMVWYLSSPEAGFITGQNIVIDGGMTKKMIYV